MISNYINNQKSIRKKLLTVIVGVTVFALVFSNLIAISASYISDSQHGYVDWSHYKWEILITIITTALGAIFAYFLAMKLQEFITKPIYHLSGLAATLAQKQDYTLRAKKFSDDELGLLAEAFNEMIVGMGENNNALTLAREDADKANHQKSAFLAMMSHEIRTPINGIIGTTDLLGESQLTGRQKEHVYIIEKSAETLLDLINDILDFSKIEAEKLKIEAIPFNIIHHIQDVIDILQVNVGQRGLRLYFTNNLQGDHYVIGDPTRIKQILINLVSNAIKFTEKGSVTITLAEGDGSSSDIKQIWISVVDTGIGIPLDSQEKIFESFSQANDTTTRKYGGTGLGLTICKKLTEMMNGTIGVQSTEGIGSTFWFSLPMPITDKPIIEKLNKPAHRAPSDNNTIMFVEDNETNIMITAEMLNQAGYETILCRNGKEAVTAYQNNPTPLILMDCQMPVMDGWEATQKIRAYEQDNNLPPATIVALTANAMQGDREKCLAAGMDDYLAKPFKKRALLEKLDSVTV